MQATEAEHSVKFGSLREAERMLADKQAELAKLVADLGERSIIADSQRVELVALRVQVEALKDASTLHEREAQEIERPPDARAQGAATAATNDLNEERGKVEKLSDRVIQLERALVAQTTEAEVLGRRVQRARGAADEQAELLADREHESASSRDELDRRAQDRERPARRARHRRDRSRAAAEGSQGKDADRGPARPVQSRAHQAAAGNRRDEARGRADLGRRAGRECAAARAHQRHRGRDRPHDGRARGTNSPIEAMLAERRRQLPARAVNGEPKPAPPAAGRGNLADRIRALQVKASRIPGDKPEFLILGIA